METQRGRQSCQIDRAKLCLGVSAYASCLIDLGTGDGHFVRSIAAAHPEQFVIGLDACREQLWESSRRALPNELYVIANALALPDELIGLASHITINFPWGTLLEGLLCSGSPLRKGLVAVARPNACLEVRLNAGALGEAGWSLEAGAAEVRRGLRTLGFDMRSAVALGAEALRACPTTWAKRLAFGRDPRAVYLRGHLLR